MWRALIVLLFLGQLSCSDDVDDPASVGDPPVDTAFGDDPSVTSLNGKWKVYCFENLTTLSTEYKTDENTWGKDIIVEFDDSLDPHGFSGVKTTNSFAGEFRYVDSRKFRLKGVISTMAGQPEWADKFDDLIGEGLYRDIAFKINNNMLRIYYDYRTKAVVLVKQ